MNQDTLGLKGKVLLVHTTKDGEVYKYETPNTIVNVGKAQVAGLINGVVTNYFEYLAIGTGTTAADPSDTGLEAEVESRGAATTSRVTTSVTNDTAQLVYTWNFTSSYAITESGIFDSSTGGTLLARQVFDAINVGSGDSLQVTWKLQVS